MMTNKEMNEKLEERDKESMREVEKAILDGRVYADVKSVSRSGMSRRICFYTISYGYDGNPYIERITHVVGWLTGWLKFQTYKQGGKYVAKEGLRVDGCGMDMVFHTLYSALPYEKAKDWNQRYHML